jgi:hypothetical protein
MRRCILEVVVELATDDIEAAEETCHFLLLLEPVAAETEADGGGGMG